MKINMNVELTPKELRELLGMPDVDGFNQVMMDKMVERMEQGMEGHDPMTFFKPYMSGSNMGMEMFQKWMTAAMGANMTTPSEDEKS